jgi:simple sugar transport system ATP-binding protein
LRAPKRGVIKLKGKELSGQGPAHFIDEGVAYISEDPLEEQIVPGLSILEHMVLAGLPIPNRGWGINWKKLKSDYGQLEIKDQLRVAESSRIASTLSGGNVQRMILARALASKPEALLVNYPSRGLDIATVKTIHRLMKELRAQGTAILLISEDLNELLELSDRLVVMSKQQLFGPYDPVEMDAYAIGSVMLEGE